MPRRTTIAFSSEDAPPLEDNNKVYAYYCKYSGRHALTTDCNLNTAPRRRTDHSLVIDTQKCTVKHYGEDGGVKLLRRRSGALEKQYRINIGKLPIAYRTEPQGRYLYILDDALTTYSSEEGAGPLGGKPPVPPCIVSTPSGGTRAVLEIEDRAPRHTILKISADAVRIQIKNSAQNSGAAAEEILDYLRNVLGVRLAALSLERGETLRQKLFMVEGLDPERVFDKMQAEMNKRKNQRPR